MRLKIFFFRIIFGVFLALVAIAMEKSNAVAQLGSELSYEVDVEVPVVKKNFVKARQKAFKLALKSALKKDLLEFLGDDEFERYRLKIKKMLQEPKKYIKFYRYIEAYDDPIKLVSQVKLEVVLSQDAVTSYLNQTGMMTGLDSGKQVVILIKESSLDSDKESHSLEIIPISETSLTRSFIEEGIPVVRRETIRYAIPEEMVISAMKGDLYAAANIGMKAGADIVIVGNATSALVKNGQTVGRQSVRAAISIKAISSRNSSLVAAKSDFATAARNEILVGELEAFRRAGKKISEFLIPAIQKYWEMNNKEKEVKKPEKTLKTKSSTLPWGDL